MLLKQLVPNVWYFTENNNNIPFVPLAKVLNDRTYKYFWIGFRLDKSENLKDFLRDVCRSIDKKDLNLYKEYIYNDIVVIIPEKDVILKGCEK